MTVQLQVLAHPDLFNAAGERIEELLRQPKRFALLTYLRLKRPAGLRQRDELLSVFWHDQPPDEARTALSQSLSFLRRTLGDGALIARGPREVGINSDVVRCDACQFEEVAATGEHARALALYAGDLLASFRMRECEPFNRWLGEARERLRDRAVTAAVALSEGALSRGDWQAARDAAERALEIDAHDEAAARALVASFEHAGRRARALEAYDAFVARLKADTGLPVSEATRLLGVSLRA